ncbi:hypothetical protein NXV14_14560 [Bacteroides fragilis]|nr:hypothetical protein [Bacteroides fragilis]
MNIIETIICGCIGGLAVVLPYIIYMRIRARRKPATAIGKPIGDRTAPVMPDKKEELPPDDLKADLYAELNKEAGKADYIPYSPDKLVIGQFGKVMHGSRENLIEYVLLSDRFLNRQESFETYFYPLSIPTISCGSFHKETGERSEGCKVIEMEVIDEARPGTVQAFSGRMESRPNIKQRSKNQ